MSSMIVTGGTGFIGLGLVRALLSQGHHVTMLSRKSAEQARVLFTDQDRDHLSWITTDLAHQDSGLPTKLQPFLVPEAVLFHCAGEVKDPDVMQALHVDGTARLIEATRGKLNTWVQLSSVGAYGPKHQGIVTETTPEAPVGPYETSKTQADELVRSAALDGAFSARILRPAIVIGPDMPNDALRQIISVLYRRRFVYFGKKTALTNYVAVDNLIEALIACPSAQGEICEVFNLAETRPLHEVIDALSRGLGIIPPSRRIPLALVYAAASLGRVVPGFPLTRSRADALSSTASYDSDKLAQNSSYSPVTDVLTMARHMAQLWRAAR